MVLQDDADRVKHLLAEAISVLCKNGLTYESELCVEGLLGITLDNSDIFLVNISETITNEGRRQQQTSATKSRISLKDKSPQGRHSKKRGHGSEPASPEPVSKRSTRTGKSSAELMDIKAEKLSIADDDSSYAGDDVGQDDNLQDMKCTRCGKMFDNPANLERHLREIHFVGVVWLCCQSCDFSHVSMKHFNYHMFRQHRKIGGRKRFPNETKFLTAQQIKYRIEHNMRVPDVSDNKPKSAAEKSGSRSQPAARDSGSSLRRTPARLSADATRRNERAQSKTADRSRVSVKTEPNVSSGPRSLRHRDPDGQVVTFSKNLKGALRRKSAPPAPATPRTAKPAPKAATPKVTPKVNPKSKVVVKEEKKATPRREQKKETTKKPEKKATPKRDDRKQAAVAKDRKKIVSDKRRDRRASSAKPVVKKKATVPPKKEAPKKTKNEQKQSPRKRTPAKKEKIVWPEGVSVKDFEIKLDQLDMSAISMSGNESDTLNSPEKKGTDKSPKTIPVKDNQELTSTAEMPSENRKGEEKSDEQQLTEKPRGEKGVDEQEAERKEKSGDEPVEENTAEKTSQEEEKTSENVSSSDAPETEKEKSEIPEKKKTSDEEKSDEDTTETETPMDLDMAEKGPVKSIKETLKEQYSQSREQLSSEQVSSTTREEKDSDAVEQVTADTTEGSDNEGEQAQSLEADTGEGENKSTEQQDELDRETDEAGKETETDKDEAEKGKQTEKGEAEKGKQTEKGEAERNTEKDEAETEKETEKNEGFVRGLMRPLVEYGAESESEPADEAGSTPGRSDRDDTETSSRTSPRGSPRARTSPRAKESSRVVVQPALSEPVQRPVERVERDFMAEDMPFIPPGSPVRSQPYYQQPPPPLPPTSQYQYPQYPPQYPPNNRGDGRDGEGSGYYYGQYNPYNPYNNQ